MSWEDDCAQIVRTRGKLIIASREPLAIGSIHADIYEDVELVTQPLRVIAVTTREDYRAQCHVLDPEHEPYYGWPYYYIVETD